MATKRSLTPRALRDGLICGEWRIKPGPLPSPPPEWPEWKQKRLAVAIRAAKLFFVHNNQWQVIRARLREDRMVDRECGITRSRINQYVQRGMEFLMSRRTFVKARGK